MALKMPKFEFYWGDLLGLLLFYFVSKATSVLFIVVSILIVGIFNFNVPAEDASNLGIIIGFFLGYLAFMKWHKRCKVKYESKMNLQRNK